MSDRLYVEPDCGAHVPHAGKCTLCGAVLQHRWLRQVEIDYEAAWKVDEMHRKLSSVKEIVDAALGMGGDDE